MYKVYLYGKDFGTSDVIIIEDNDGAPTPEITTTVFKDINYLYRQRKGVQDYKKEYQRK